jgi:hypothetical protein
VDSEAARRARTHALPMVLSDEDADDLLAIWDKCMVMTGRMLKNPSTIDRDLYDALMDTARQCQRYVKTPVRIPMPGEVLEFLEEAAKGPKYEP